MVARLRQRTSRMASLSARLAVAAVPVLVFAAVGHQVGRIDDWAALMIAAGGFALALLAVLAAIAAFAAIWQDGRKGFGAAAWGLFLGLVLLSYPGLAAFRIATTPWLPDVSTDPEDPPLLVATRSERPAWARSTDLPSPQAAALQEAALPQLQPHRYGGDPARVYAAVMDLVAAHGWRLLDAVPPDGIDDLAGAEVDAAGPMGPPLPDPVPRRRPDPDEPASPALTAENVGMVEAVASATLFGFPDDIAIRLRVDDGETVVDMRSASRFFAHDLGSNARRITAFMNELDLKLAGLDMD